MTNVINFQRKPKEYKESHFMSCVREDDWIVWRCHECSRKVKSNIGTDEFVIDKQGNFYAHHMFQCYQPSKAEWEKAGVPPMEIGFDLDFPQIGGTSGPKDRSYTAGASEGSGTEK
jgi:hypothetical protein